MSKSSSKKPGKKDWATGLVDGKTKNGAKEAFALIGVSLWKHPAYLALNPRTQQLYDRMILECRGNQEFIFPLHTAKLYGFSVTTFRRAVRELEAAGFIKTVQSGQITREPNRYRFIFDWKLARGKTDGAKTDSKDSSNSKND